MNRYLLSLMALVLVGAVVTGCGKSDKPAPNSVEASIEETIEEVDTIVEEATEAPADAETETAEENTETETETTETTEEADAAETVEADTETEEGETESTETADTETTEETTTEATETEDDVATLPDGEYAIVAENSRVQWTGEKLTGDKHWGTFPATGTLTIAEGAASGTITLDVAGMTVDDLEGAQAQGLVDHLAEESFFNTATHPTATFEITALSETSLTGSLTVKDTTISLNSPVIATENNGTVNVKGTIYMSREAMNINLSGATNALLKDVVPIELDLELA